MERIINPDEYTPEIVACIDTIKYRMRMTSTEFTNDNILVVENEGIIYILGNPILGEEPIYDECGGIQEMAPLHNITIIYQDVRTKTEKTDDSYKYTISYPMPRLRIMRPDLCMRVESDGTITDGGYNVKNPIYPFYDVGKIE